MCKHCKKEITVTDVKQQTGNSFLTDGLCPACYMLLMIKPIDKEILRCEEILATCRSSRMRLLKTIEDSRQAYLRTRNIEIRLAAEKPFSCKCGQMFAKEPEYVQHAYACTGHAPATQKQESTKATRAERSRKLQEVSI